MKPKHKILMEIFMEKARKLGYSVYTFDADRITYKISKGAKSIFTIGKHFPFNTHAAFEIVKRKDLTKQILEKEKFPTPKGILTDDWEVVKKAIGDGKIKFPLVAKPDTALAGQSVIVKIGDIEILRRVYKRIKKKYGKVLIEEYCEGEDFRFLVLDGRVLAVARRVPPFVVGDGKSRISELIKKHNVGRGHDSLKLGFEVERVLEEQKIGYKDIPRKGRKILLRRNANIHTGGIVENVTDITDNKFKRIAVAAAKLFNLRFSGVDIICPNITDPKSKYFIVELNTDPGYDLHWMDSMGHQYDATKDVLNSMFSDKLEQ